MGERVGKVWASNLIPVPECVSLRTEQCVCLAKTRNPRASALCFIAATHRMSERDWAWGGGGGDGGVCRAVLVPRASGRRVITSTRTIFDTDLLVLVH